MMRFVKDITDLSLVLLERQPHRLSGGYLLECNRFSSHAGETDPQKS